ncbi:MAG: hypothetical protein COB37_01325 [Kordiimonadales bacterium]|nr:MAG: hypothetical protein COB37_01325 [Kordiimonadales bacterium]
MTIVTFDEAGVCANCGGSPGLKFCEQCGQKSKTERLNAFQLLKVGILTVLDADAKVLMTLKALLINPGQVALDYISGARVRYINPIKLFFVSVAIMVAVVAMTGEVATTMKATGSSAADMADLDAQAGTDMVGIMVAMEYVIATWLQGLVVFTMPLFCLLVTAQHRKRGRNYAEVLVLTCYTYGFANLLGVLVSIAMFLSGYFFIWLKLIIIAGYFMMSARTFFALSNVRTVFSFILSALLYIVAMYLVLIPFVSARYAGFL